MFGDVVGAKFFNFGGVHQEKFGGVHPQIHTPVKYLVMYVEYPSLCVAQICRSDDGRLAKALHGIIDGDDDDEGGRHEYGGKQYGGINSCIVFYVGTG